MYSKTQNKGVYCTCGVLLLGGSEIWTKIKPYPANVDNMANS